MGYCTLLSIVQIKIGPQVGLYLLRTSGRDSRMAITGQLTHRVAQIMHILGANHHLSVKPAIRKSG
jgi:hypothetical protein